MDPFSLATGCVALIEAIGKSIGHISAFIKLVHNARPEMLALKETMQKLKRILDLLNSEDQHRHPLNGSSEESTDHLKLLVNDCLDDIQSVNRAIEGHQGPLGALEWALTGRSAIETLNQSLRRRMEDFRMALDLVDQYVMYLFIASESRNTGGERDDANKAHSCTSQEIKDDTTRILQNQDEIKAELSLLSEGLKSLRNAHLDFPRDDHCPTSENHGLEETSYLDPLFRFHEPIESNAR